MRISDWSSAVCSSDLSRRARLIRTPAAAGGRRARGCAKLPASKPNEGDTAMAKGPNARDKLRAFTPKLIELTEGVLFGDVWERPGLSKRDRGLITVAAPVSLARDAHPRPPLARSESRTEGQE